MELYIAAYIVMAYFTYLAAGLAFQGKNYKPVFGVLLAVVWPAFILVSLIAKAIKPPPR